MPLEEQHGHGLADDVRAAHHQCARAGQRRLRLVEEPEDPQRRARPQAGTAGEEGARAVRAEAVDVLLRSQRLEHFVGGNVPGQRELHQHAVDVGIDVQLPDQREQLHFGRLLRKDVLEARHAGLLAGFRLAPDVDLARRIVADADQRQPRSHSGALLDLLDRLRDLGAHLRGNGLAIDDHWRASSTVDRGRITVNVAPSPGLLWTVTVPPCRRTSSRTIQRPRP